jgi:hypothetical protein
MKRVEGDEVGVEGGGFIGWLEFLWRRRPRLRLPTPGKLLPTTSQARLETGLRLDWASR